MMTVALRVGTQTQTHTHPVFPFEWMMVVNVDRKMAPLKELYRVQEIAKSQMS